MFFLQEIFINTEMEHYSGFVRRYELFEEKNNGIFIFIPKGIIITIMSTR